MVKFSRLSPLPRRTMITRCKSLQLPQRAPLLWICLALLATAQELPAQEVDFAHEVVPILRKHCGECHTGGQAQGELSLNTRESLLRGGASGAAIVPGDVAQGELMARLETDDVDLQMPPEGPRLSEKELDVVRRWIAGGAIWEPGFTFAPEAYEPPLLPRRPELPAVVQGRENPIDRIIDNYFVVQGIERPQPLSDGAFLRRVHLDLVGLLPEPELASQFLADTNPNKRESLIASLLADNTRYAEHWLSFWNDLLRNDYDGTGFITGGRKQITSWLYDALVNNKPYDQFARELLAPGPESTGFADGIRWRGTVSAGQTVEIQFAQSVGQSFLGINLKCASCHNSFLDRWTLEDAYGLAAIYAESPQEIHRCDKPIGKTAQAQWLFPEIGQIDPQLPRQERLQQLAQLMTHPDNGRFSRTLVNRLWYRLMGYGIVHPMDAMQSPPWNDDLLDFLAVDFVEHGYDIKHTLALIASSQAYQSQTLALADESGSGKFQYRGPQAKRMTAEQFVDALWQITGAGPTTYDAPIKRRSQSDTGNSVEREPAGSWVWAYAAGSSNRPAAGEAIVIKRNYTIDAIPKRAVAVVSCDNSFILSVNGKKVLQGDNWEKPTTGDFTQFLQPGENEFLIVAKNGGASPNPAGVYGTFHFLHADGAETGMGTDTSWSWSATLPAEQAEGTELNFVSRPSDWQPVAIVDNPELWAARVAPAVREAVLSIDSESMMVRAALRKSDFLQRTLGRPNRDQIVSMRPDRLSTLEAIDLNNAQMMADLLAAGAARITQEQGGDAEQIIHWVYTFAYARTPTDAEQKLAIAMLGQQVDAVAVEDLLWAVLMQPEFMIIR